MPSLSAPAPPDITTLDQSPENATDALYRAAIGPINTDYYLAVFTRFELTGRAGPSWNWAACLNTLNWMIFRHLWAAAGVYFSAVLGLLLVVFGIGRLLFQWSEPVSLNWLVVCGGLAFVLPGIFGNAIFHARSRRQMDAALTANPTLAKARQQLNQQASTRQRFVGLVFVNLTLGSLAALAYVAWPLVAVRPLSPVTQPVTGNFPQSVPMGASQAAGLATVPASTPSSVVSAPVASSESASAPAGGKSMDTPPVNLAASTSRVTPLNAASSPVVGQRYFINVGLFAKDANARNAYDKLRASGLPAFTQRLKGRTRVRVGPFASQPEAEVAAEQIHALQLDAVVFQP